LPTGILSNPVSPFPVSPGQSTSVVFGADSTASAGQFNVTAVGSSGALSHSANLSLTIKTVVQQNLPRSAYIQNDSVAALDTPAGEPHRRHIIYDSAHQRFFVANRAMNRVEVLSSTNSTIQASVDVPAASSVDLSPDGATLWVGSALEYAFAIDTQSLQVKRRYSVAGLNPIPGLIFNRPTELLAMSGGKLLVRLRQSAAAEALLALWDPVANTFTNLTSSAPAVFQNGVGVIAPSGDRTSAFVTANDSSGEVALFDANGIVLTGPQTLGVGAIGFAAVNNDASRIAVVLSAGGSAQLHLLDAHLNPLGTYATSAAAGLVFSRDSQTLYLSEPLGNSRVITALSASNLQKIGQVSDLAIQAIPSLIEDVDGSQLLAGLSNRGVSFLDVSNPATLNSPAAVFSNPPVAQPAEGAGAGGATVVLSGANFSSNAEVRFGSQNAVNATVLSASQLQATAPPSASSGPVNLTAYFSSGWTALAPDAFSYGPSILRVLPSAASKTAGNTIAIYGYGFGSDPGKLAVSIGGQAATVQRVDPLPAFAASLSLDGSYPFSLERITLTTPAGSAGKADISISAPSGSTTLSQAFQFLASSQTYPNPSLYKFVLYDQSRQQLYLSATDHVDVFNLPSQVFRSPLQPPPNGPPPDAALRGLALTPDHSQLVVADFGAQSVYLINPDGGANNGVKVPVGGVAGFLNSGPARVAATSLQTVFVGLSGEGTSTGGCNACLGQLNITSGQPTYQSAPQPEVSSITGAPLLQSDALGDTLFLAFDSAPRGPVASWSASNPNAFTVSSANDTSSDLTTSSDGNFFAMRASNSTEIRGADLTLLATPTAAELESIPQRVAVPGVALHPTGALVYEPFLDGPPPAAPPAIGIRGGIDIRDAHNGRLRLRLYLPEPFAMLSTDVDGLHGSFLTTDENGQRLFALTTSGLTVVQLASVPLGIGSVSPASGAASGGTSVSIRGSGFQSDTKITLGGKPASVTFKDMNTLNVITPALSSGPQQLILTNPDGESVSLDAAFLAQ